jgi:hypothetical protein
MTFTTFIMAPSFLQKRFITASLAVLVTFAYANVEAAKGGKPGGGTSPPEITSISPGSGPIEGGTSVTINGRNFSKQASVMFGGLAVTSINVRNGKRMTVTTPANPSGAVDVTVNNPDAQSVTLVDGFTYQGQQAQVPATPSSLSASADSSSQINLTWIDNADNEDGFVIERSLDGSSFGQIDSVGLNTQSYSDSGLTPEQTFYYRVAAFNNIGDSGYTNTAQATTLSQASVVAFPGAEGFGTTTAGGRGGQIIEVTNLNNSGAGSFRAAVETAGPRIVVFTSGGIIELQTPVEIHEPFITIAAQTAPGDGIALKGEGLYIHTHDVIVRSLRVRIGDLGTPTNSRDGINISTTGTNSRRDDIYIDDNTESGSSFYIEGNLTDDARVSATPFPARILNRNNYPIDTFSQFTQSGISMDPTLDVFDLVLNNAGAIVPIRDAVDARVVAQVISRTGGVIDSQSEVGGWPSYNSGSAPTDSDHDGMPDSWESLHGLDPFNANDRNELAPSGYTWVEEYVNGLIPMP